MGGSVAIGTIMYDSTLSCVRVFKSPGWSNCLCDKCDGGTPTPTLVSDCTKNGFTGAYVGNVPLSGATFSVTLTNNSVAATTVAFQPSDLVLSGTPAAGLTVSSVSPNSATLTSGQSQVITYTITGTPSTASGTLTGTWTKLSLSCNNSTDLQSGTVNSINCTGLLTGSIVDQQTASGVTKVIGYSTTGTFNYPAMNINSTGATGLTMSIPAGTLNNGNGNLTFSITGSTDIVTRNEPSIATFTVNLGGKICSFTINIQTSEGSFDNPSVSCQSIFDKYNSSGILVADDGEYWIGTPTAKYKTKCDMVNAAEAAALDKEVGGYTLLWSYSEGTSKTDNSWATNGKISWGTSTLDNRNVVTTENGTMNYNNFRISTTEKARWTDKKVRQTFTDNPLNANLALQTYIHYPTSNIINGGHYFRNPASGDITGKYLGGDFIISKNPTGNRSTLTIDGIMIKNNIYFYNGQYNTHWDNTDYRYSSTINNGNGAIISNFPLWVVNEWTSEMPFGHCKNTTNFTAKPPEGLTGGASRVFSDACLPNGTTIDKHPGINGTEGYVMQWWAK
jgi:hypothetical protein